MNLYQNSKFYALLCFAVLAVQAAWLRFPGTGKSADKRAGYDLDLLFCICTAVAVGTLFHLYPGNHLYPTGDSAVFIYIGKQMMAGKVPYLDCFDHKGPLLYLIQFTGLSLGKGSIHGLWALEVINMTITLLILVQFCRLASNRRSSVWLALLMSFVACGWRIYEGGNFTEEYALPWISLALLVFFRFFQSGNYGKRDIVLLGIAFSAVFLLRPNMIAVWVACMPMVLLHMLRKKRFRDLGICTGLFFAGVFFAVCPILIWLASRHALKEFVECYFSFNMLYSAEVGLDSSMLLHLIKVFSLMILPGMLALAISVSVHGRDSLRMINLWCFAVSFLMLAMSGRDYPHYLIIILPPLAFFFTDFFDWTASLVKKLAIEPNRMVLILSCFAILTGSIGYHVITGKKIWPETAAITWLKENTVKTDDVLVLGNNVWTYLASDRKTGNRFFYQTPPIEISNDFRVALLRELHDHPSDVILDPIGHSDQAEDWRGDVYRQLLQQGYSYQQINSFSVYFRL